MNHDTHDGIGFVSSAGHLAVTCDPDGGSAPPLSPALLSAEVLEHRHVADRYWFLRIDAPRIAASAQPGQFVMLTVTRDGESGPVLPRPMAIYDWDRVEGTLDVLYGVVGAGTRRLASFRRGERITVVGPLGRGFQVDGRTSKILLVGRGIGTCSLTALAAHARRNDVAVVAVDSARNLRALIADVTYRQLGILERYQVTDEDGSSDPQRLRARLVADLDAQPPQQIFVCGSDRLTSMCVGLSDRWHADLQVSLEAHMACGLGYCHGCSSGQRTADAEAPLICRDGPVFRWVRDGAGVPA